MRISINPSSAIKARLGIQNGGKAHAFFTSTCFNKMTKYVPGGTKSHLNQNVHLETDSITYQSPSAHYLWNGKKYVDPKYKVGAFYNPDYGFWSRRGITKIPTNEDLIYHTPGTGAHWDKLMWNSCGKEVIKKTEEYIKKGCKE